MDHVFAECVSKTTAKPIKIRSILWHLQLHALRHVDPNQTGFRIKLKPREDGGDVLQKPLTVASIFDVQ